MSIRKRVTVLLLSVVVAGGVGLVAPSTASAQTWAACPANYSVDQTKMVRSFPRAAGQQIVAGVGNLRCGTSGYGYRHVADGHSRDWFNLAAGTQFNNDWRSMADYAIQEALRAPSSTSYRSDNKTTAYYGRINVQDTRGRVVKTVTTIVVVSTTNLNIITAYYTS